jgi:hypothetical protein
LSEPPKLSDQEHRRELHVDINPFAPTSMGVERHHVVGRVNLSSSYWVGFALLLFVSILMTLSGIPMGWLALIASIAAAVRVPLLQRRHSRYDRTTNLLPPFALFFTSLAMMIPFVVVSFIAFAAVCIPTTIAFETVAAGFRIAALSGLVSLLCFVTMFVLSLRLRF